jgi:hypothetical protein
MVASFEQQPQPAAGYFMPGFGTRRGKISAHCTLFCILKIIIASSLEEVDGMQI